MEISNRFDEPVIVGDTKKLINTVETFTDMGLCRTFNSFVAPIISPNYISSSNQCQVLIDLYNVNYFDIEKIAFIANMNGSDVKYFKTFCFSLIIDRTL